MVSACSVRAHSLAVMDASGETAEEHSGPADHMGVSVGEGEDQTAHKLSNLLEHPRVTRLRYRRLIAFLRDQGFHDSYNELTNKTRAHMSLGHLHGLANRDRWLDAIEYLDRYLPPHGSPRSYPAQVLRQFLLMHHRFANAVDGIVDKSVPRNYLQLNNARTISHADLRLRSISFSILAIDEVRANMNWERVRERSAIVVSRLARSTPELRGCIQLPATSIKPHHVLPIASGLWSRRRYLKKRQTGRPEAIVRESLQLTVPGIGSLEEAQELLADLLDESIRYGVQLSTNGLNRLLKSGRNEGTNEHGVEKGGHTNTDRQDLDERRNDLLPGPKRQRLTREFRESSPVLPEPGAVGNFGAKLSGPSPGEETAGP